MSSMVESEPAVITVDELAALLRLHRNQVYQQLQLGAIPGARKIGGTYRISRHKVLEWLSAGDGRPEKRRRG